MMANNRDWLPSRPVPLCEQEKKKQQQDIEEAKGKEATTATVSESRDDGALFPLDAERLIGTTRIGGASVSPDGRLAAFEVKKYDFDAKKFDNQIWLADLDAEEEANVNSSSGATSSHLRRLTSGSQHEWASINSPKFSPCGNYIAFLSNQSSGSDKKTSVWTMPVKGPGEATLLKQFPLSVSDLDWSHDAGGIIVSASVYVDGKDGDGNRSNDKDAMAATAARDKVLEDSEGHLGGLNAVLFKRLPVREWDRWIDAKMTHPFFVPVEKDDDGGGYKVGGGKSATAVDLLQGVPTAVPSGAFGGSEDWTVSKNGAVAVSARPPIAEDEAWTTNRHIYLMENIPSSSKSTKANDDDDDNFEELLGECLTKDNPGFDTNPVFSPDGKRLAWLTMSGPTYEADAVGIRVHDLDTKITSTLLEAETDWAHSPNSLTWSKDGKTIFFTADVRSRQALCSIDSTEGAKGEGGIQILKGDQSTSFIGEVAATDGGHILLTSVQSLTMPTELFLFDTRKKSMTRQLTHFNTERIANTLLGEAEEFIYKGAKGEDVQSWFIRPAGFTKQDEEGGENKKKYPLAVIYHGGPQGSTGDDWHYRWNLQYYASMGFAVLAPNFHGSTGFGHQFCRDISGNWEVGGHDTIDGVRAVLEEHSSWIDADRVVGMGASYGGFTSNWLNGNAPEGMFKALVCHCGTFDLRSSYYATEELFFMETEFGGPAYTKEARNPNSSYNAFTPSAKVSNWKTPTLVIHGAKDFRLVESEGISTFTALQRQGVPSEFLYLPTENHHCLNPQNSMVWHEAVMRWIKTWTEADDSATAEP